MRNPETYEYTDMEGEIKKYKGRVLPRGTPLGIYASELMVADEAVSQVERTNNLFIC